MKKIIAVALLTMFGLAGKSQAAFITKSISSTTFVSGFAASDVLLLKPQESMNYTLTGTVTGTMLLEKSVDGGANYTLIFSSTNGSGGTRTGTEYASDLTTRYRFRASTVTGSGSFYVTLTDNDDVVGELRNRKGVPFITFTDERVIVPKLSFEPTGDTSIAMTAASTFTATQFPRSFVLVTSTGGAIVMTAVPTVPIADARTGDVYIIQSTTATITVQDEGTLTGSALELGASTRALGVGDILVLIYRGSKWWEISFANN